MAISGPNTRAAPSSLKRTTIEPVSPVNRKVTASLCTPVTTLL